MDTGNTLPVVGVVMEQDAACRSDDEVRWSFQYADGTLAGLGIDEKTVPFVVEQDGSRKTLL